MDSSTLQGKLVWEPKDVASTSMDAFRRTVNAKFSLQLQTYEQLWRWSCEHLDAFWTLVWDETQIVSSARAAHAIADDAPIYPPPRWFEGTRLNFAENLLRHRHSDRTAVVQSTEVDTSTGALDEASISYRELYRLTAQAVAAMRTRGIQPHDRIASYSANNIENLVTFLAASSIGAVWTSAAADFGPEGVLDRLRTVRPKLLLSVNAVRYNGKVHDHLAKLQAVVDGLEADRTADEQALQGVILVPYIQSHPLPELPAQPDAQRPTWTTWADFLDEGRDATEITFEQLDFNHPLWILFSSGTTGKPKAITHRAGGMLIQLSKEHLIHGGLGRDDVFFQHTTTGWMMWNFLIAALVSGCTIVLYDGSPLKPVSVLWELAERHGVTTFGTSAAYLGALEKTGYEVRERHTLRVRQILSTGSPLRAELYPFVLNKIGADILVGSVTGGTDLCSLFAGHNVALPVRAGEIQARNLGMDVGVWDVAAGREVDVGAVGDLVCRRPFPAQPLGLWGQPEARYFASYYAQVPHMWYHGDWVQLSPVGGLVMHGRSDGILNPGGVRFGSSEIYELLESSAHPLLATIADSLVVALQTPARDDEVICLFLVLHQPPPDLAAFTAQLSTLIRTRRSPRHVPRFIELVPDIPRTLNGKKVEIPVKHLINGALLASINRATLLNPDSLVPFVALGEKLRATLAA